MGDNQGGMYFVPERADEDEEDDEEVPFSQFEIVGLYECNNGRSCIQHVCCGEEVVVGDILRLQKTLVETPDFQVEEAIACILVRAGEEKCRVGFVPRALHEWEPVLKHINKHAQVVELYRTSRNSAKRRKSHMNMGIAGCVFLDEIPQQE
jgi:hypothetical protein